MNEPLSNPAALQDKKSAPDRAIEETLAQPPPSTAVPNPSDRTGAEQAETLFQEGQGNAPAALPRVHCPPGYEILGRLGQGGMGVVYKARQIGLGRVVALKMIVSGVHAGEYERTRFRKEAEAIARLRHDNIVQIFEVGEHEGDPFFSLEFCEQAGLDGLLKERSLSPMETAEFVEQLAGGMYHAHQAGIVHRDLKPANVLLSGGKPKITDFGLAKREGDVSQTQSGQVMGTPCYMAPEQASGRTKSVGPAADIYALGAILYECLTGKPPFLGESVIDTLKQVIALAPTPPRRIRGSTPRELEAICLKCLNKDPGERYASAEALADDLARFRRGEQVSAGREPLGARLWRAVRQRRRALGWAGLALCGIAATVAVTIFLAGEHPRDDSAPADAKPPQGPDVPTKEADAFVQLRQREVEREINSIKRTPPLRIDAHPAGAVEVDNVARPDHADFDILEDFRIWDLRGWKTVPAAEPAQLISAVTGVARLRVRRIGPADEYVQEWRTSGAELFVRCLSHPKSYRTIIQKAPAFVGQQQTKVRQCAVDLRDLPLNKETDLQFAATFWNNLQTPSERWLGVIGYKQSFKISMLILFPEDRPFTSYRLTIAPTVKGVEVPFEGRKIFLKDERSTYLFWEILEPKEGYVYRAHWEW
jgi:hypothetical protein